MQSSSQEDIVISSLDKDGRSIASSEPSQEHQLPELENPVRNGSYFPESSPSRQLYLAARYTSVALGVLLIILAVLATAVINRPKWLAPVLSPAINAGYSSMVNILTVTRWDRRYRQIQRLLYDGAIGVGCAVAGGFLVAFTLGDIQGTSAGAGAGTRAVAWLILFSMFAEM